MKKFFLSLVMLLSISVASVFAQTSLIATLSHEGEITAFYGASALQQAHEAAAHGDVITLSSGTFLATDIKKAITLRGAGMELDSVSGIFPTVLAENIDINIADETTEHLTIEGIYHNGYIYAKENTLENVRFIKCRLYSFRGFNMDVLNATFVHCKIVNAIHNVNGSFVNCYLYSCTANPSQYVNCIINNPVGGSSFANFVGCELVNCILLATNASNDVLPKTSSAFNNVAIGACSQFYGKIDNTTNQHSTLNEVFKDFTGDYNDNITFELTDEAKTKFLGTDGTQVGIYGGAMPFDPITTNPRITKCSVAAKSTADGKLSVDIEVNGAE